MKEYRYIIVVSMFGLVWLYAAAKLVTVAILKAKKEQERNGSQEEKEV